MLKSLHITNLQSHQDSLLEFEPGVNVIIGDSRKGKTSIFRALRKVLENRPVTGLEAWVHRHNKKPIRITLATDDHTVSWEGPNSQKYLVDGLELKAFGQSVPEQVTMAINIGDINIQDQFDQPFLVFDPPGQVAKVLNRVANLDIIDQTLANVNSLRRRNQQDIGTVQKTINIWEVQESEFPDLEAAEQFIETLEDAERKMLGSADKLNRLVLMQTDLAKIRARRKSIGPMVASHGKVKSLVEKHEHLRQLAYTSGLLQSIQNNLADIGARRAELGKVTTHSGMVGTLFSTKTTIDQMRRGVASTKAIQRSLDTVRKDRAVKLETIKSLEAEFQELWPGRCPLCGK